MRNDERTPAVNEPVDWERVRQEMVRVAIHECDVRWAGGTRREHDPAMHPVIETYWREGCYNGGAVPPSRDIPDEPWSAAFISYVVFAAGGRDRWSKVDAEPNYQREFRPIGHWRYTAPAKINTEMNSAINPFRAFPVYGPARVRPQVGDVVVKSREPDVATFEDFYFKRTHGDVVIDVRAGVIETIGGNLGDSVRRTTAALTPDGFLDTTGGRNNDPFAIVRINGPVVA